MIWPPIMTRPLNNRRIADRRGARGLQAGREDPGQESLWLYLLSHGRSRRVCPSAALSWTSTLSLPAGSRSSIGGRPVTAEMILDSDGDSHWNSLSENSRPRVLTCTEKEAFPARSTGLDTKKGINAEWGDYEDCGFPDILVTDSADVNMREGNFLRHNNGSLTLTYFSGETGGRDMRYGGSRFLRI
jgi:hypothetical protein